MKRGVWGALVALMSVVAFSASSVAADPPQFQVDPFWPKPAQQLAAGPGGSVAVGLDDHVWPLQRPLYSPTMRRCDAEAAAQQVLCAGAVGDGI